MNKQNESTLRGLLKEVLASKKRVAALVIVFFLGLSISYVASHPERFQTDIAPARGAITAEDTLTLLPNGAGTYHEWDDVAQTGYEDVDDDPHDSDVTYVEESTATKKESFVFEDHTDETETITAVRVYVVAKYTVTEQSLSLLLRNGTNEVSSAQSITSDYAEYYNEWTTNPYTDNPWTWSAIDDIEAGMKHEGDDTIRVTQCRIVVYYGASTTTGWAYTIQYYTPDFLILAGMVMIPASTLFLAYQKKNNNLKMDHVFLFLVAFMLAWGLIMAGIQP